jgi:hypothetical protein
VFVALGFQHAMLKRHIVNCDLSGSTFFQIISLTAGFSGEKVIQYEMCGSIASANFV